MKKLKYIVIGMPRCGTVYMAKWLTAAGIPCGHECIFTPQGYQEAVNRLLRPSCIEVSDVCKRSNHTIDNSVLMADSSYMAVPFINTPPFDNAIIIHVTRHPLLCVRSLVLDGKFLLSREPENIWEKFMFKHVPELSRDISPIERGCLFYCHWTKMIKRSHYFHRQEDNIQRLANWLKVKNTNIDRRTNTWQGDIKKDLFLSSIPKGKIKDLFVETGLSQGYTMDSLTSSLL